MTMSSDGSKIDGEKENKVVALDESEDEDDPIDEEQLDDYKEMIEELGGFPVSGRNDVFAVSRVLQIFLLFLVGVFYRTR